MAVSLLNLIEEGDIGDIAKKKYISLLAQHNENQLKINTVLENIEHQLSLSHSGEVEEVLTPIHELLGGLPQ